MTGLEKILKAIEDDADALVEKILSEAKAVADEITEAAKKEAEKKCLEIASKSEMDVQAALSRAQSAASLIERKTILDAKQQLINDVIAKAKDKLTTLSDSEYTETIIRMVKKNAHNTSGTIVFSEADKKRLPKDFDTMLKKALEDKDGASLTISENNTKHSGFVLIYGEIEENCTFEALFATAKDELQDRVNEILF